MFYRKGDAAQITFNSNIMTNIYIGACFCQFITFVFPKICAP